jgi:hypothetical protein
MTVSKDIWQDPVWSKVIAGAIGSIFGGVVTALKQRLSRLSSIKLTVTHRAVSGQQGRGHPLKYYVEMLNESSKCIEVGIVKYNPKTITVKSFPPEAMQIRFQSEWFPQASQPKVAVLPGQSCRAWIAIDDQKFTEDQVKAATGHIGTLIVSANKKQFSFEL